MDRLVEIEIKDLAFDGKAVGHLDGKVVFLNAGLPGERVEARILKQKKRFNTAKVIRILTPSPERSEPRCQHFGVCGGCAWQDLAYERQLEHKQRQVVGCLEHLGGFENPPVEPIVPCRPEFGYRNKMEFSFHVDSDADYGFRLGLHERGRWDRIFDIETCHLPSARVNRIVHAVREYVRTADLPVYDVNEHTGYMRFLVFREAFATGELLVNVVTNTGPWSDRDGLIAAICSVDPNVTTIVHNENGQKSNVAFGEQETVLYGPGYVEEGLLGQRFRIRANSFFQTNGVQTSTLYETLFATVEMQPSDRLLDLYCGTGTIGLLAASRVASVIGVEEVEPAIVAARENAALNAIDNARFVRGDCRAYLREQAPSDGPFSVVVTDPPRAGMHPRVVQRLIEYAPERIGYVSCNPSTFARDARQFVDAGYALERVVPVDMFPHTKHIEVVARFIRN